MIISESLNLQSCFLQFRPLPQRPSIRSPMLNASGTLMGRSVSITKGDAAAQIDLRIIDQPLKLIRCLAHCRIGADQVRPARLHRRFRQLDLHAIGIHRLSRQNLVKRILGIGQQARLNIGR